MTIRKGHECTVVVSGMVFINDGIKLSYNNSAVLDDGTLMTIGNMTVHVLSDSDHFDLHSRKLEVLGIDAPFI